MSTHIAIGWLLALLAGPALASGFDQAAFERLDPDQLRAAEARIHELLEPGTARLLRVPANAAEAYVVQRQQRLAAAIHQRAAAHRQADGSSTLQAFWPTARATRAVVASDGRIELRCQDAASMIGHHTPDFRHGNPPREVIQ